MEYKVGSAIASPITSMCRLKTSMDDLGPQPALNSMSGAGGPGFYQHVQQNSDRPAQARRQPGMGADPSTLRVLASEPKKVPISAGHFDGGLRNPQWSTADPGTR